MLLGAKINVHTDHKNITHNVSKFTTQCVMRWRLLLEEFGPTFFYKKGVENIVEDAFSRVPTSSIERRLGRKHDVSVRQALVPETQVAYPTGVPAQVAKEANIAYPTGDLAQVAKEAQVA